MKKRGRPKGIEKERSHLYLDKRILEYYRDKVAWDERCNFSTLIERALLAYRPMEETNVECSE